ncbi:mast cell protease 8-like [Centroberyx affinis]|uniref:mast cell protease 8-like n=1 Tax=Centroberyx affinis TaxID=166261 RepID=UPI003A5C1C85
MMRGLYTFLLFHVLTCLGQKALGSEIINGKKAHEKSLLYMASVQFNEKHACGGFLVSKEFVVTAAHCDLKTNAKMTVVLGTHDLKRVNKKTMRYNVVKYKHLSFVNISSGNDIMLLKLSRKAKLSKTMNTIQLPSQNEIIKANTKCIVAGWGRNETKGTVVDQLRVVDVSTIDLDVCQKEWNQIPGGPITLPANIICAGGYETNKGSCQGDSGGPLVCNGKAVGIVSFNYRKICDYPTVPNVYTEISKFLPWIKKIIKEKACKVY